MRLTASNENRYTRTHDAGEVNGEGFGEEEKVDVGEGFWVQVGIGLTEGVVVG